MEKFTYVAVETCENGRNCAQVVKVGHYDNLLSKLKIDGIVSATICRTKKEAYGLADYWNECFKANGTYLFQEATA